MEGLSLKGKTKVKNLNAKTSSISDLSQVWFMFVSEKLFQRLSCDPSPLVIYCRVGNPVRTYFINYLDEVCLSVFLYKEQRSQHFAEKEQNVISIMRDLSHVKKVQVGIW